MKKYPDGNYSKKAQLKKEELTFEDESFLNNIGKLKQWIASSPESTFTEKAKKRIEELAFAQAKYDNNTVSLEGYIIDYPDGEFVSEAKQLLEVIKIEQAEKNIEKLAFGDAKTKDTINAYKEFIVKYPDSHLNTMAKGILEAKYFENASRNGTVEAYKEFIEHYPDGSHMKEARLMIDKYNFELYKKKDRISDFEKFIKKYPDNRYVGNARVRIDQLNLEYQQKKNTLKTNEEFVNKYPKNRDINEAKQKIIILQTSNIEEESDSGFPFLLTVIIFSGVGIAIAGVLMRKRVVSMVQSWQQGDWSCECGTKHNKELEDCSACGNTRPKFNRASLIGYAKWLREKPYAMYGKIPEKEVIAQKTKDIQAKAINTFDKIKEYHDKLEKERKEKYQTIIDTNECSQGKKSSSKVEFDKPVVTTSINSPPPSTSGFISKADKMGFPRFYKNVSGEGGLTWEAILEDYGECLYPGKGFSNSCLAAIDPILCILKKGPSQNDNIKCWKFREALGQRLSEINEGFKLIADVPMHTQNPSVTDGRNQESLVLYLIDRYLALFTNFTKTYDGKEMKNDKEEMDWAIDELTKLLDYCSRLEQSSCESLKKRIQMGIDRHKELVGNFSDFAKQQPIQASTTPPPTPTSDSIMEENMYKFKNIRMIYHFN